MKKNFLPRVNNKLKEIFSKFIKKRKKKKFKKNCNQILAITKIYLKIKFMNKKMKKIMN